MTSWYKFIFLSCSMSCYGNNKSTIFNPQTQRFIVRVSFKKDIYSYYVLIRCSLQVISISALMTNSSIIMGLALLIQNQLYKYLCKKYIEPVAPWLILINQKNQVDVLGISFHQTMLIESLFLIIITILPFGPLQIKSNLGYVIDVIWILTIGKILNSIRNYQTRRVAKILPSLPSIPLEDYPRIIEASF